MRALTLTQPWAGLVAAGIKLVENRPRKIIAPSSFGQEFAIHASREIDDAVYARLREIAPELFGAGLIRDEPWYDLTRITSAVIGVGRVTGYVEGDKHIYQRIAGIAPLPPEQLRFLFGPIGYVLAPDIRTLEEPIACKGALGFWTLPTDVAESVRRDVDRQVNRAAQGW